MQNSNVVLSALLLAAMTLPTALTARGAEESPGAASLAMQTLTPRDAAPLAVQSPAFRNEGDIPFENTQYRGNVFPGLSWSKGPAGTRSYAIIMQDPDGLHDGMPNLHWTLFNIPARVTTLDPGMKAPPHGATPGPNMRGARQPYLGPHTPPGPKHHYHLQVFALDTALPADSGRDYAALTAAMQGHVLKDGELTGLAQADRIVPP